MILPLPFIYLLRREFGLQVHMLQRPSQASFIGDYIDTIVLQHAAGPIRWGGGGVGCG